MPSRKIFNALIIACCLPLLAACATGFSFAKARPTTELQWPPKPAPAKIQWVKTLSGYQDVGIEKGFWKKALEFFVGEENSHIVKPHGVLFDGADRLFIADPGGSTVHYMNLNERRYTVVGPISNGIQLRTPIGLAEDEQGLLYITDSTAGMVYVYDIARGLLKPFLSEPLDRPTGIAYNRMNKLVYVVETGTGRIIAFDAAGDEVRRFGSPGDKAAQFNHPTDITVDVKGQVIITDPLNYRIKLFTPEGVLVTQFGGAGDSAGYFNKPKGVATDSEGHIYVCDALLDMVQLFDDSGQLLLYFGHTGTGNGEFWMPSGIFIDRNDYIFVADTYNQRIQVFRYLSPARSLAESLDATGTDAVAPGLQPVKGGK
jgi:DNA-binding beta-propeller fold protein YncE